MDNCITQEYKGFILNDSVMESTPKLKNITVKSAILSSDTSSRHSLNSSSGLLQYERCVSVEENVNMSDELKNKEEQYDRFIYTIEQQLTLILKNYSLESEILSQAEEYICTIAERYSLRVLGEVLTRIYITNYGNQNVIAGICSGLEHFDANDVFPWGQGIIIGLINHKSELVKERVISVIDNWGDTSLLQVLKNIDISSTWMKEYVRGVIKYLEEKQCTM